MKVETKFQKGQSGNPNGRTKGAVNEATKKFTNIRNLATQDYAEAYAELRAAMKAGEGWAHSLFFKELVPKSAYFPIIEASNSNLSTDDQLRDLIEKLPSFGGVTHEEALSRINTLSKVKLVEKEADRENTVADWSTESVKEMMEIIQREKQAKEAKLFKE